MPFDGKGKFQLSGLKKGSDGKLPTGTAPPRAPKAPAVSEKPETKDVQNSGESMTIHKVGQDAFHTSHSDGTEEDHPDHLHMATHVMSKMGPEGKHAAAHSDGMEMKSHGVGESGEHDGTHDHGNIEELKDSMGKFLDEEGSEGHDGGTEVAGAHDSGKSYGSFGGDVG
jgi:hypothetical protein